MTSNMAQGVKAVKEWMFPPLLGNRMVGSHGAFSTLSITAVATPATQDKIFLTIA